MVAFKMVVLLGATMGAKVLAEFAFTLGRTARGVFSRPVAATTTAVVMVVDLVFAFSARDELVVVVVFVRAILGVLAALVVQMLGFRAMHVARFLRLAFRVCLVGPSALLVLLKVLEMAVFTATIMMGLAFSTIRVIGLIPAPLMMRVGTYLSFVAVFEFLAHLVLRRASNFLLALDLKRAIVESGVKNRFEILGEQIKRLVDKFSPALDVL